MLRLTPGTLGVLLALARMRALDLDGKAAERTSGTRLPMLPLARDPSAAVAEEYDAAHRKDTTEAYELFIARHG